MAELIRTFVAIELPEDTGTELKTLEDTIKRGRFEIVKWVDPSAVHLTLKFLGDISSEQVASVLDCLKEAAAGISTFRLNLSGLGAFPNLQRPRVVWVGIAGDLNTLKALQKNVDNSLSKLNLVPEDRPFSPHLTLGRVRDRAEAREKSRLGELIKTIKFDQGSTFTVAAFNLMRSVLTPAGAVYSCLGAVNLERNQEC